MQIVNEAPGNYDYVFVGRFGDRDKPESLSK
jgi:hypothetical protein